MRKSRNQIAAKDEQRDRSSFLWRFSAIQARQNALYLSAGATAERCETMNCTRR
jgi:hypothetical protein